MKALTIIWPWSWLWLRGAKSHETRTWKTQYRGRLLVTTSQRLPSDYHRLAGHFNTMLLKQGMPTIPDPTYWLGRATGVIQLTDCRPTNRELLNAAEPTDPLDAAFGDWTSGRYAWRGQLGQMLPRSINIRPRPVGGMLGVWQPAENLIREIDEALRVGGSYGR